MLCVPSMLPGTSLGFAEPPKAYLIGLQHFRLIPQIAESYRGSNF